jgi:hypothetical protein
MSSSSRSAVRRALLVAPLALASAPAFAQQTYVVPRVEATAEWNSNREMVEDGSQEDATEGYKINADVLVGRRTQTTTLEVRPRVQFQEFPDRDGVDPVDYALDARAEHVGVKGTVGAIARYARQDVFNAEYGNPGFDDLQPEDPGVDSSGIVFVGGTRETARVEPSFRWNFSQRTAFGGSASYERVDYSSDIEFDRVGYDAQYAELVVIRALGPRSELEIGPYYAHSETDTGSNETDSVGARVTWTHEATETTYFTVSGVVEQNDITDFVPEPVESDSTEWGVEFSGFYRQRVGGIRYSIGRFLRPSTLGSRRASDQVRVQYIRPLSPLMTFNAALRATRDKRIGGDDVPVVENRDRAIAELTLTRQITPTFYVTGGARYAWQDLGGESNANNYGVFLGFGWRGLDRREARTR